MLNLTRIVAIVAMATITSALASAQAATSLVKPISIGISGGVAVPMGDLPNGSNNGFTGVNTGYNVTGSLGVGFPLLPFSLRGDVSYNSFGTKNLAFSAPNANNTAYNAPYNADARVLGVTGNVVFPLPVNAILLRPYLIGGVGVYNVHIAPTNGSSSSENNFGFNIGAGITVPLVAFNAFAEARYHRVSQRNGSAMAALRSCRSPLA